jgi:hypothetical protein
MNIEEIRLNGTKPIPTIAGEWDHCARFLIPSDVGHCQRLITRAAFYAGVQTMLNIVTDIGKIGDAQAGAQALDAIYEESTRFAATQVADSALIAISHKG